MAINKAILIGETGLCIQCAGYLLLRKWKIPYIVSDDQTVVGWAKNNHIKVISTIQLDNIKESNFYLFSIINPYIIPKSFLINKKTILALNYHDSLLPKYAGVNSTTWAILNNEKSYGVTLHKITAGIDDGDIVAQSVIDIEKDETAISLNLKCSEHLLSLFKNVITKIETNTLSFSKQNLTKRSYYGLKYLPVNYGIINGIKDVNKLSQLVRGLNFGNGYDNPVASVKIWLNGKFYIAEDFVSTATKKPKRGTILFNKVKDIYGNGTNLKVKYHDILAAYQLTRSGLQYLSNVKEQERKYKKQILEFLKTYSNASITILDQVTNKSKKYTKEISLSSKASDATIFAIVYLVLARFFYRDDFIVSLYNSDSDNSIPAKLQSLVENRGFIHVNTDMLSHGFDYLKNYLTQAQKKCCTMVKDFGYRYSLQLLTDIAIAIGGVASIDQHKIIIKIRKNGRLVIEGYIAYQPQIDSIAESIRAIFNENTQKEIATKDLKHINLLSKARYQQIVYNWNKTEKDYPKDKTIHQLFEEQVLKTPDNIAVVYENIKLTYRELNQRSNQLANYLVQNYRVKPDELIALCLDRSEQIIIAMLGVLKSGAAYVPIDPGYPDERIGYILKDTKANVVLTNGIYENKLQKIVKQKVKRTKKAKIIAVDDEIIQSKLIDQKNTNPTVTTTSTNLVYVIYTSGTTGDPKGVMIEHKNVVSLVRDVDYVSVSTNDSFIHLSDPGFDATTFEVWASLLNGARLNIPANKTTLFSDIRLFKKVLTKNSITILWLTKTLFDHLFIHSKAIFKNIKYLLVGGEALNKYLISELTNSDHKPKNIINGYGPTENTTFSCTLNITKKNIKNTISVPIGVPLTNRKAYVLDDNLNILPVGVIGELHVTGTGLGRGYLNQLALTRKKFIANPFQTKKEKALGKNARLYKTGDLVRLLPDGNLEFIGRNDFQVKIRGFRVELGEVEEKLVGYPGIKQAVVLAKERGELRDKHLLAYYVADKKLEETKIQAHLASQLPEYMLPRMLVYLNKLPLTINGKLDRKALPEPELTKSSEYVAPRNELEQKLCEIYAQVLDLPIRQIGIKNDFFVLGGDSISSIRVALKIRQQLRLDVNVKDIFEQKTIEQLADILEDQEHKRESTNNTQDLEIKNFYLANNLQQGFISHAIKQGKIDNAYLSQFIWQYKTPINESKFKIAWRLVYKKYPGLRLKFAWDNELIQIIDQNQKVDFRYIELTNSSAKTHFEYQVEEIIKKDRQEYYDLQKGNLLRVYLIKLSKSNYSCICSLHHIVFDGWSFPLLLNSLHEVYTQLLKNQQVNIVEDTVYQKAQDYLQKHKNEDHKYWRNRIGQIKERVNLKSLLKPSAQNVEIENYSLVKEEQEQCIEIIGQKLDELKKTCQANAITTNSVIQYAWHKLLHIYGNSDTTVIGTVVSGRNLPIDNIENSVGLFINTLPLVFNHNSKLTLIEQIKVIQDLINEANSRSNVNLADLQSGDQRLFDSLIAYENYPEPKNTANIKYKNIQVFIKVDYPLVIVVDEKERAVNIKLKYAGELFDNESILQLLNRMRFFIEQILENPHKKSLVYLTQEEYQRIAIDYNKTEKDYPANKTIHQLFEEQVLKTPGNIAVVYENKKLTYQELNQKANQLANYLLHNYDIKPDDLIVLCLDRSEQMIIAMLGVLKAGGAYVPVDPNYPDERVKYVLNDARTEIILTNDVYKSRLQQIIERKTKNTNVIALNNEEIQINLIKQKDINPIVSTTSANLIYVIYTSGTTGNPRGVLVEHKSVVNCITYVVSYNELDSKGVGSQYAATSFDASVIEIYPILLSGGALYIMSEQDKLDAVKVDDFCYKNNITYAFLPTKFAELFFKFKNSSLINLIVAGEKLEKFVEQPCRVSNGYGPTENTVYTTNFIVNKQYENIPIGRPINNVKCYVVDSCLNLLPINAIGELVIGGEGLARGYLNRSGLISEKFISNPFQTNGEKLQNKNSRLYRTGDLVKLLPDGNLEYIGRNDDQIKIRGYRIELGEIENQLLNYPQILQAAVTLKVAENNKYLIAYYVADNQLDQSKLRDYLLSQLPNYMVPSIFIYMRKLPVTINGKLDKKALPKPDLETRDKHITPKNKREQLICEAFAKVLGRQEVGIEDDFFLLGGNSIQAIRLASMLQENFDIKVADIFNLRTPEKMAKNSLFGKNFLNHKLEQVKYAYRTSKNEKEFININEQQKLNFYAKSFKKLNLDVSLKKKIHGVLLTGSTGYLGCNIVNQLLKLTDYKIYLLIRANSQLEATERIIKKYQFYFGESLDKVIGVRVFAIVADIEKDYLGLLEGEYQALIKKVDSVIHAAALVKHYGEYDKFYAANVKATVNLLEFARLTKPRDFHYISTIGVLNYIPVVKNIESNCTENDLPLTAEIADNVYVQTKLLGEHQVTRYRDLGLNCNIYRVGNLAFISKNYRVRENPEDNTFYNWLKYLFTIKCVAKKIIDEVEMSQVDLTAQAIVKIFDKKCLDNQTYHIFNSNTLNMVKFFRNKGCKILSMESFIDHIGQHVKNCNYHDSIPMFLLHQGWTYWLDGQKITFNKILQDRTRYILKQLNFEWPLITDDIVCDYINSLKFVREV